MTLFEIFNQDVLSPAGVVERAIREYLVPPRNDPEFIKGNFSTMVEELQIAAYDVYLEEEKRSGQNALARIVKDQLPPSCSAEESAALVSGMFGDFDRFFLSLTQSRRARAGTAFQLILRMLFKNLGYPFDEQQVINGKPDFLMPGIDHFRANPMDCIIFTVKRTLRERWRQIVTEGTRGLGFYLATIDDKVPPGQLREMLQHRINLVVPERIKNDIIAYSEAPNVVSFESFFSDYLDPAMTRWESRGVIGRLPTLT